MLIGVVDGHPPIVSRSTLDAVTQIQAVGEDLILARHMRWAIVFQKAGDRLWYGSHQAFGHDGAGGAIGIGDPWHDMAYGWIPRRMTTPDGADERGLRLAQLVRDCAKDVGDD